jgi:hypothetical protein
MNNTRDPGVVQMGASRGAGPFLPAGKTCDSGAVKMGASFRLPSTKAASMASRDAGLTLSVGKGRTQANACRVDHQPAGACLET